MMALPLFVYLFIELLAVSWVDFKTKLISNYWSMLHLVFFVFAAFFFPHVYPISLNTFLYPLLFVLVGFMLFVLKVMGGGDSKFLATFYLLIPPYFHDEFTEILLLSTILVGAWLLVMNIAKNFKHILYELRHERQIQVKNMSEKASSPLRQ